MIVMTMKAKGKWVLFGVLTAISLAILAVVFFCGARGEQWAVAADLRYRLSAETAAERIAFLEQFGWTVEPEPVEVEEVAIPAEFNDVYQNYNAIQLEQGLDLAPYAGKTCKRWVYQVCNYPREGERILATLLVYDGQVIGGDISSANLDGFMTGFLGEPDSAPAADAPVDSAPTMESAADEVVSELPADAFPTD